MSNTGSFADDTSIIVPNHSHIEFTNLYNKVFEYINEWFRFNQLFLIFDKIYYLQFITIYSHKISKLLIFTRNNFLHYSLIVHYHGIKILLN